MIARCWTWSRPGTGLPVDCQAGAATRSRCSAGNASFGLAQVEQDVHCPVGQHLVCHRDRMVLLTDADRPHAAAALRHQVGVCRSSASPV